MSFHPPLGTTTFVPLSSDSSASTLHFTYLSSTASAESIPEIWTDLPVDGEGWHAIPFQPSSSSPNLFTASVSLSSVSTPAAYEYTYRLVHASGEVDWLGSTGSNGRVEVVAHSPPTSSSQAPTLIATEDGQGRWDELAENVAVGRFPLRTGGKSTDVEDFDVTKLLESEEAGGGGFLDGEGVVWEQSNRTWLVPRVLPAGQPLQALSPTFPAQLLVFRSIPTAAHPNQRTLVLFPFSTRDVCSSLVGGESDSERKLLLHCERDSPEKDVEGHLAVAWGPDGSLSDLLQACIAAARSVLLNKPYEPPTSSFGGSPLSEPYPLSLCTWNALGPDYTLSDVLSWLDAFELSSLASHPSSSPSALPKGAVKSVLLDDGWADVSDYVDYLDPLEEEHAAVTPPNQRRALRSFGVRKGWWDLGGTEGLPASVAQSGTATPSEASAAEGRERSRSLSGDSGYGHSPEISFSSAGGRCGFEDVRAQAREGVCRELVDGVRRIKARGIERVGVWMTLLGYWKGISPDGALADVYNLRLTTFQCKSHDYSYRFYFPSPADIPTFYRDYFTSLRAAGVDFVKVDDQATIDSIVSQEGPSDVEDGEEQEDQAEPGELKHLILDSMRQAAADIFGAAEEADATAVHLSVLHCMAGSPRIWGGDLALLGSGSTSKNGRVLVRNQDDFFPDVPDAQRWNVAHNALGAVLSGALPGFEPDFDMAQAAHPYGKAHLALRAFSAAPLYSTDAPAGGEEEEDERSAGKEKEDEGMPGSWTDLLALTKSEPRIVQARPGTVGTVLGGRLAEDVVGRYDSSSAAAEKPALLVGLPVEHARGAHFGAWNCRPGEEHASTVIDTKDLGDALGAAVELDDSDESVLLFSSTSPSSGTAEPFVASLPLAELATARSRPRALAKPVTAVDLPKAGVQVFTLARLCSLPFSSASSAGKGGTVRIACLGLTDKIVGLAAVRKLEVVRGGGTGESSAPSPPPSSASSRSSGGSVSRRSPSPTTTTTPFPVPQARLPFLLFYLIGLLPSPSPASSAASSVSSDPTASSTTPAPRTFTSELRALVAALVRSPVRTFVGEVAALVGTGWAAVLWGLGSFAGRSGHRGGAGRAVVEAPVVQPGERKEGREDAARLEVGLEFLSPSVGFFLAPSSSTSATIGELTASRLRFTLDGHPVADDLVRLRKVTGSEGVLVEVDAERAWQAAKGEGVSVGVGGEAMEEEGEGWRLSVAVVA
ncbi:hypothetical protein JCM8097_006679 [Rhodosporidiobolus ruineniae]